MKTTAPSPATLPPTPHASGMRRAAKRSHEAGSGAALEKAVTNLDENDMAALAAYFVERKPT